MTATAEIQPLGGFDSLLDDSFIFNRIKQSDYPQFVTKTIQMLSRQSGLKLLFSDTITQSCFIPSTKTVVIPPPPAFPKSNKDKKEFIEKLGEWRGILNHEVGHAMFTLWRAKEINPKEEDKEYNAIYHTFVDLFENGRMERMISEFFPGAANDLKKLESLLGNIIKGLYEKDPDNFNYLYYGMRMAINGYKQVIDIPEKLKEDWDTCMGFVLEAYETNDEKETIKIAKKVYAFFKNKQHEVKEEKDQNKKKKEENNKKVQQAKNKIKDLDDEIKKGQDAKKEEDVREELEKEDAKKEEFEKEIEALEEKEDVKEDAKKEELEKEIEALEKEIESLEKENDNIEQDELKEDSFNPEKVVPVDALKKLAKDIKTQIKKQPIAKSQPVCPLPLHDYVDVEIINPPKNNDQTKKTLHECLKSVSGMAQRFIQKVRSSVNVGVRTYQGRISRKNLHRYKTTKNIFQQEMKRKKKGASVMIVIDCSYSMNASNKIGTARKAALVAGEIMYQAKVDFEVVGFTVPYSSSFNYGAFTRTANLIHYRFGGYKNWQTTKCCVVDGVMKSGLADNDDGESLRHFADELYQSKKERKIMVVISDGQPSSVAQKGNGHKDLINTIQEIRKNGAEVYAIGLNTDAAQYYGEKNSIMLESNCNTVDLVKAIDQFIGLIAQN